MSESRLMIPGSERIPDRRSGTQITERAVDYRIQKTVSVYLKRYTPAALAALQVLASENNLLMNPGTPESSVQLIGKLGDLQKAFYAGDTSFYTAVNAKQEFMARTGSLGIPLALAQACAAPGKLLLQEGDIAVLGLDTRPIASPRLTRQLAFASRPGPLYPRQAAKAYGLPAGVGDGSGVVLGIISLGGGVRPANVQAYCQKIGCSVPDISWVPVDGGGNNPGSDADVENDLDVNVMIDVLAYAFGPSHKAKIVVAAASNTDQGFADALNTLIQRGIAHISISWGSQEAAWSGQGRAVMQNLAQGTKAKIFCASGDDGDRDGSQGKAVDFLASMPEVFGVGGTTLTLDGSGNRSTETVWGGTPGDGAAGGGVSVYYTKPSYQSAYPQLKGRGVPDVAAVADPATGLLIWTDQGLTPIGGTSGSTPLMATCFAVMDFLGINLTHDLLYAHQEWFFDITVGNNTPRVSATRRTEMGDSAQMVGCDPVGNPMYYVDKTAQPRFPAGPGYDVASGLGVLDFSKVIATLKGSGGTTAPPPVTTDPNLVHLEVVGAALGFIPTVNASGVCFSKKS